MSKRATAKEVAELAGVSRTTVSFVLNNVPGMRISEDTRQKVLEAARMLEYHPDATARRMVTGLTRVIGFVLRQSEDEAFADHFLPQVLNGLSQSAGNQGYHVMIQPFPPEQKTQPYLQLLRERHVDGIVLSGPRSDDPELAQLVETGAKVVLLGQLPGSNIPFVDVNNVGGAQMATQHLIAGGHHCIAMITNAPPEYTASTDRLAGYRLALESAGIPFDPALVHYGNFTPESGYRAMSEIILTRPAPTAVFVASDTVALGVLQATRHYQLNVPEDFALVGFDDIPLAEFTDPPLTSVRLPAFGLGWGAAELLIRLLAQDDVKETGILLETELIVRASSGVKPNM